MSDTAPEALVFTLDDLLRCGADELLANPTPAIADHEMWSRLFAGAQASVADQSKAAALDFLAKICSMRLDPDDRAALFKPMMSSSRGRSPLPDDLTGTEIALMADIAPSVHHAPLRARLADLIWLKDRRRGIGFAHMAIEAYRQTPIASDEMGFEVLKYRQRAIQVALLTGKGGGALVTEIASELLGAFWAALATGDQAAMLRYLRPLQNERLARDKAGQIAEALERVARRQLETGDPFGSMLLAESAVFWFGRARTDERRAAMQILVAKSWVV